MSHSCLLGFQIEQVVRGRSHLNWDTFCNLQTELGKLVYLIRIIGQQAQIEAEQITFCAKKKLELPGLVIDNTRHEISANGRNVSLTRLESDLLWVLAVCEGTTLSKKELFDAVWGKDCADTLKVVGNTVSNLRKKLAFCGLDGCLCTVGGGYAFRYVLAEQGKAHSNTVPTMVYCCPKELRENDPNLVHLSGEYLP